VKFARGDARTRELSARAAHARKAKRKPTRPPPPLVTLDDSVACATWVWEQQTNGRIGEHAADVMNRTLREFRASVKDAEMGRELARLRGEVARLKARGNGGA
jgi:hypothetical protein